VIENVGNLVCPAEFNLGEHDKVVILSVAEGDDKPLKYPLMFQISSACLVNKVDLLPYVDCDMARIRQSLRQLNGSQAVFEVSCRSGEGMDSWLSWLEGKVREQKESASR
jgi:hydrogenase nickel incorporation protein HypB